MPEPLLIRSLLMAAAAGGLGLYLMLPARHGLPDSLVRRAGACLFGLSLVFLSVYFAGRAGWWPESLLDARERSATFAVLAGSSVVLAVLSVTARTPASAAVWFGLLLAANAGLFLMQQAAFTAAASVVVHAVLLCGGAVVLTQAVGRSVLQRPDRISREPLLACTAGVLLAAGLTVVVHRAVTVESRPEADRQGRVWTAAAAIIESDQAAGAAETATAAGRFPHAGDFHLLNNALLTGAMLFALGAVGFLARRNMIVMLISAGVMLQAVILTLTAFGTFHATASGQVLALCAVGATLIEGAAFIVIVSVCGGRRNSLDVSHWQELRDPQAPAAEDGDHDSDDAADSQATDDSEETPRGAHEKPRGRLKPAGL